MTFMKMANFRRNIYNSLHVNIMCNIFTYCGCRWYNFNDRTVLARPFYFGFL